MNILTFPYEIRCALSLFVTMRDEFKFPPEEISFDCRDEKASLILIRDNTEAILPCADIKEFHTDEYLIAEWARAFAALQCNKVNVKDLLDKHPPHKEICLQFLRNAGFVAPGVAN